MFLPHGRNGSWPGDPLTRDPHSLGPAISSTAGKPCSEALTLLVKHPSRALALHGVCSGTRPTPAAGLHMLHRPAGTEGHPGPRCVAEVTLTSPDTVLCGDGRDA